MTSTPRRPRAGSEFQACLRRVTAVTRNWLWLNCRALARIPWSALSGVQDDALEEQGEAGAAVHLPLEHLDLGDVALYGGGAVGQGQPGGDGLLVAADAVGEGPQFGQVAGLGLGEPALQFPFALAPGHDLGEAA